MKFFGASLLKYKYWTFLHTKFEDKMPRFISQIDFKNPNKLYSWPNVCADQNGFLDYCCLSTINYSRTTHNIQPLFLQMIQCETTSHIIYNHPPTFNYHPNEKLSTPNISFDSLLLSLHSIFLCLTFLSLFISVSPFSFSTYFFFFISRRICWKIQTNKK